MSPIKNDTKTFLGFVDTPIDNKKKNNNINDDQSDCENDGVFPYLTKIGGSPIWCAQPPNHLKDIKCGKCSSSMVFLIQAYCPLNSLPNYERNFYIFLCPNNECHSTSSGWRVIKCLDPLKEEDEDEEAQEQTKQEETKPKEEEKPKDDWGIEDTDDWGISTNTNETTTTTTTNIDQLLKIRDEALKEEKRKLKEEQTNKNITKYEDDECKNEEEIISGFVYSDDSSNYFQPFNLYIDEESMYSNNNSINNTSVMKNYEKLDSQFGDDASEWSNETYEYVKDRIFNKFIKKISMAPDQCLRYSYNGKPLPMTEEGVQLTTNPESCGTCGTKKIFEFQILSTLIAQIKLRDQSKKNTLDFSNTFVYSCPN
ncbi:hypothetical protein DICPUDRAFT_54428, partial [Dictyostelium purpureum]